ncbi:MAG: site-specific integrase [Alicyclobacillus macrosporangiidus]|uniref:site-specific integrase n=1 Tax=Alicyclobacillus macrosporangiidus TaxID=392015 RepID=UPI0026EEC433|nr:site-specific integrase [Alicyclobacillus macrosporangiidus]MCL6598957.1 site-specific integrase [Alicyclobacillus macrosporangiidus]
MRGSVTKKGSKWYVVIDIGRDANGKRQQKWFSGYRTKREAERGLAEKLQEIQSGVYVEPTKDTLGAFLMSWLADKQQQIRPGTYRSYRWLVEHRILPQLGSVRLADLKPAHLQAAYRAWLESDPPLSPRSVRYAHALIHAALDRALKWGLVARNVADAVDPPRQERHEITVWTPEDVAAFLEANEDAEPRYFVGFVLAIYTGMRKGEILALRWEDIDAERGVLYVRNTLVWSRGEPIFQPPKTDRSRRAVALSDTVLAALRRHRALQAQDRLLYGTEYQDNGLVLARPDGRPLYTRTFDDAWYRALERAPVPKIRFHDLRHTHASLLLAQGTHPKIVSERLGHSTITLTLDTYSHLLPGLQQRAADEFDALIRTGERGNAANR